MKIENSPNNMFIKRIQSWIGRPETILRRGDRESIHISYFAKTKHGGPGYDQENNEWERVDANDDNLMIDCYSDHRVGIRQGDDSGHFLHTTLRSADELTEFLWFYKNANPDSIGKGKCPSVPLSSWIDKVFILVQATEKDSPQLLPLNVEKIKSHPEVYKFIGSYFGPVDEISPDLNYWHLGYLLDNKNLRDSLGTLINPLHADVFINCEGKIGYLGDIIESSNNRSAEGACLVLRTKNESCSTMWLTDYLEFAHEAEGLPLEILKNWAALDKFFKQTTISPPSLKHQQIAASIALRNARYHYLNEVKQLSSTREPFKSIREQFKKRADSIALLHTDHLEEVASMQNPLPFFLEYPFRKFRKASDHTEKVKAAKKLLTALARIPLFLILEELLDKGSPLASKIITELEEKPASDGTLVSYQATVSRTAIDQVLPNLDIFRELCSCISDTAPLEVMVKARNNANHEPFDDDELIRVIAEKSPSIIASLRNALKGVRFLIPHSIQNLESKCILKAEDVSSSDDHFAFIELEVTLPLAAFPTNELIVWKGNPEKSLKIGRLIKSEVFQHRVRDFGIFDKVKSEERIFTYFKK